MSITVTYRPVREFRYRPLTLHPLLIHFQVLDKVKFNYFK